MFCLCCYSSENAYKIYKWIPNDEKYDKINGEQGKRVMKLKEKSSCCRRCITPASWRSYRGHYISEYDRKVVFTLEKPLKAGICCAQRPTLEVNLLDNELKPLEDEFKTADPSRQGDLTNNDISKVDEEQQLQKPQSHQKVFKDGSILVPSKKIGTCTIPHTFCSFNC